MNAITNSASQSQSQGRSQTQTQAMTSLVPPLRYRVTHETRYRYAAPVSLSRQWLHLTPRPHPLQTVLFSHIDVNLVAQRRSDGFDAFGNPTVLLEIERPHRELAVIATMDVEVHAPPPRTLSASMPWEQVAAMLRFCAGRAPALEILDAARYTAQSPFVQVKNLLADHAREVFTPQRPIFEAAHALMRRIYSEFTYDPKATTVGTQVVELLASHRGVCQDYAHFMIACLRSLGLSARYVSGYLRTLREDEEPALIGADASHAWVSVFCPHAGWMDLDPTNDVIPKQAHVTLAWGRDFGDVSPLRGIILGGGEHQLKVGVSVLPQK